MNRKSAPPWMFLWNIPRRREVRIAKKIIITLIPLFGRHPSWLARQLVEKLMSDALIRHNSGVSLTCLQESVKLTTPVATAWCVNLNPLKLTN